MSGHRQHDSRHSSSRHSSSRRDSSPSRYRRDSRRSSPGPSRGRSPPRTDSLPEQFGRVLEKREEDDSTVLQCMKRSFTYNPLGCLTKCVNGNQKLKVWTRNYKEVRGICTGRLVAFDKHWNMVLSDVNEVYLKPKKSKTPYLYDMKSGDNLQELPPKAPKQKKTAADKDAPEPTPEVEVPPSATDESGQKSKRKKRRKKKQSDAENRFMKQCFIRGDNIVMVAVINESEPTDEEDASAAQDT